MQRLIHGTRRVLSCANALSVCRKATQEPDLKLPTMCNAVTQTGAASLHGLMTSPASRDTDLRVGVTLVIYLNN